MKSRFKNLANYALSCIRRYKVRTLVILVCLGIAASVFSSISFLKDGLIAEGELSLKYAPDLTVQGISAGRQTFIDTRYADFIRRIEGIKLVEPRVWGYGNIGNTLLVIVGVDPNTVNASAGATPYPLEAGSFLSPGGSGMVVLGKGVSDLLGAKVGSVLTMRSESNEAFQYFVVGVFNSESTIYNADMILMSIGDAREFFDIGEDRASDLAVYLNDVEPSSYNSVLNQVAQRISAITNSRVLTKDIVLKAQETTYGARSGYFSVTWYVLLIAVAVIAFNQTVVVGHESKFEVGLLKALGFSTTDIIQVRLIESLVLGALAASIGLTFGIIYDVVLNAPILRDFMLGWATLYPNFAVPSFISAQTVFLTYAVTIVPLLFATVIPSWVNATVDPDIAMRGARA
jgi:ABC-type lipoprotein release transport system permease subunit